MSKYRSQRKYSIGLQSSTHDKGFTSPAPHLASKTQTPSLTNFIRNRLDSKSVSKTPEKIFHKRNKSYSGEYSSQLVSSVVGNYIIPLFESKIRSIKRNSRPEFSGAYKDLKLSQKIQKEKAELQDSLQVYKQQAQDSQQTVFELKNQIKQVQKRAYMNQTFNFTLLFQQSLGLKQMHRLQQHHYVSDTRLKQLQRTNKDLIKTNKNLTKRLNEERMDNDKLSNQVVQLNHGYSLLEMQNIIMGEKLKGLVQALSSITTYQINTGNLTDQLKLFSENFKDFFSQYEDIANKICKCALLSNQHAKVSHLIMQARDLSEITRIQQTKYLINKIQSYKKKIGKIQKQRDQALADHTDLSNKYQILFKEFQIIQKKVKFMTAMNSHGNQEQFCKHCQKPFYQNNNFNWSCRRHRSAFNGSVYFCCGSTKQDSIGCQVSKHEARVHQAADIVKPVQNTFCPVIFIQTCREIGHSFGDCVKDPNIRTNYIPDQEIERISKIIEEKGYQKQIKQMGFTQDEAVLSQDEDEIVEAKKQVNLKKISE